MPACYVDREESNDQFTGDSLDRYQRDRDVRPCDESVSGIDHSPGYLRAAAKMLAGK